MAIIQVVKVWNGSAFVAKPVKVWNGTTWAEKQAKWWDGVSWRPYQPFLIDSFTGASGTALASHVGELGASWTKHPSYAGNAVISNANRMRWDTTGSQSGYYASAIPPTAEYYVEAVFYVASKVGHQGIAGRVSTSADTMYLLQHAAASNIWNLWKGSAGSFTLLGSYGQSLTAGNSYTARLEIKDASKKVFIDGVERISSTDNTITTAGRIAVRMDDGSNTTGIHLDSITAQRV